ncbi:MAG: M28 family peptidase [Chloracidobacterium sp.]|nr:M28 family peptidase [Chloracidobacterium sp.]
MGRRRFDVGSQNVKDLKIKPKRTIRVIAWMNEENGGRGSAAYEKEESANIANHFAAIEADLGSSHPLGILFTAKPEIQAFLAPISQARCRKARGRLNCRRAGWVLILPH